MTEQQLEKLTKIKNQIEDIWTEVGNIEDELKANLSDENYQDFGDIWSLSGSVGECHRKASELLGQKDGKPTHAAKISR